MKINVLPRSIANMIAAGEVVERPASVVKELVENSIDAGATTVTVEVQKGGMSYIRITDDGCGIEPDEVETAFLRHATSKIKTEEDLNAIYTLGFRGEALASIAAVARVEIFTKTRDNTFGRCVTIEGGEIVESDDAGCSDGTTIIVRDLFFNTPARMKFLKNDSTETGYITDTVNKMILSHPEVKIKLIVGGKMTVSSPGDGKLLSAIYAVYGKDYQKNMIEVDYQEDGIEVTGFVGNSSVARKDRRAQVFFINGRYIASKVMSAAVNEAFQNTVMVGKYPVAILMTKVNGNFVDVNVHPTKTEVRFSDDKKVYHSVFWAVKNALSVKKYVPEVAMRPQSVNAAAAIMRQEAVKEQNKATQLDINLLRDSFFKNPPAPSAPPAPKSEPPKMQEEIADHIAKNAFFAKDDISSLSSSGAPAPEIPKPEPKSEPKSEPEKPKPAMLKAGVDFSVVGQVFATYIIVQKDNEMLIIDQHAAQERIFFEQLVADYEAKELPVQILLLPQTVSLEPVQFASVCENFDFFASLGFECEEFGESAIVIRAVPSAIADADIKDTFLSVAELLSGGCANVKKTLAEEALHTMACKRAIKGNSVLSKAEMESLAEKVLSFDYINTCPHGRPICVSMTKYEMEKQFKRIV